MLRNRVIPISLFLFALSIPIAALAADAAAPTASAAKGTVWTIADYLKAAFSGLAGGLISGLVALVIGWMGNKTALKINQQKIDADRVALERAHEKQLEKILYEEKKKLCIELLDLCSFDLIKNGDYNFSKIRNLVISISVFTTNSYSQYILRLTGFINQHPYLIGCNTSTNRCERLKKQIKLLKDEYNMMYTFVVYLTQAMLQGENLDEYLAEARTHGPDLGLSDEFLNGGKSM